MAFSTHRLLSSALPVIVVVALSACVKKPPVLATPPPPPPAAAPTVTTASTTPPPPPARPPEPPPIPTEPPVRSNALLPWNDRPIEEVNGPNSPLKPVFFAYDSDELDDAAKKILAVNADVLKQYPTWVITVEGHTDERGTAEYNLALGDRRALTARNYLISLGIAADRLRTVSYGKEFPFDAEHSEGAWHQNRRAHFMLTSK